MVNRHNTENQPWWFSRTASITSAIIVTALVTAGGVYWGMKSHYDYILSQTHPSFATSTPYKFVHPLIGIALPGDQFNAGFPDVRGDIASAVSALPAGTLSRYAVYFRDLNSGNWTGIKENDLYYPASMLKVVVAIGAYRQAEETPGYLYSSLVYTPAIAQINDELPFALPTDMQIGQSYGIPLLVKKALTDSDNGAVYTLLQSISEPVLDDLYKELSVPAPSDTSSVDYKISAKQYSRFFRVLYNGTFSLKWADSEQILEDLNKSTFVSGLVAGVPTSVQVAHKYGEHVNGSNGVATDIELSDCGIIYYTPRPYFLCVMTEGKDQSDLQGIIAQISKLVYQKVSATEK